MSGKGQSVSETVGWLTFPREAYPNLYLNVPRIRHRFRGYFGSVRDFTKSVGKSGQANASMKAVFVNAGVQGGGSEGTEIAYDLGDPLAQVLVLRAYLASKGELAADARSTPVTDFALARGSGGLIQPHDVEDGLIWEERGIASDVAGEIAAEQHRQAAISTAEDPYPLYWVAYAKTDRGLVVSLLGGASLFGTDVRSWLGVDMTYCIFGQKIRDWNEWTLLQPLHVWLEPPGRPSWG
jgi:hypothetical protein